MIIGQIHSRSARALTEISNNLLLLQNVQFKFYGDSTKLIYQNPPRIYKLQFTDGPTNLEIMPDCENGLSISCIS